MANGIAQWLDSLGLGQYAQAFAENDVDAETLRELTGDDLKELGVASLGHRKKLLVAIAGLSPRGEASAVVGDGAAPVTYTPAHLAQRIVASRGSILGERKQVTVLFADIQGSTEIIEGLDPEQAAARLEPAVKAMMDAVHRFEGTVNKVQGDGIMALFGAPIAHEDHAVRACHAALTIQRAIGSFGSKTQAAATQVRVGLHSGEVVVRTIRNDLSLDYDAIGPTVHLASRMEQSAAPGGIRLTADTLRLAEGFVEVEAVGDLAVKGISRPVPAFDLVRVRDSATRFEAAVSRGLTHFVGRRDELTALRRALELAVQGRGQVVSIVGEPGVGKSRLIREFVRSDETRGYLVLESAAVSHEQASPWLPFIHMLRNYFDIVGNEDDELDHADKVAAMLDAVDPGLRQTLPALLTLLGINTRDPVWDSLDPPQRRRLILDAAKSLLIHESQARPVVLVFENLQWVDGETQALIDTLVASLSAARLLLLVSYRPEYRHNWGDRSYYARLRLDLLSGEGTDDLLRALLGSDPSLATLKNMLIERTEGNPLFLEECVRSLAEAGTIDGSPGAYRLTGAADYVAIPSSVQVIIAARIDRLGPEVKHLLQIAAVIGEHVPKSILLEVAGLSHEDLTDNLSALTASEFLHEARLFPQIEYSFAHALTREVTYAGMLGARRKAVHARTAAAMERMRPERLTEVVERLAEHFERAEIMGKAASYYLAAAEKAKAQFTYENAEGFARKVLMIAAQNDGVESDMVHAWVLLGDLASFRGDIEAANDCYNNALEGVTIESQRPLIANRRHRIGYAERDGSRIAFYEHGSGEETLLFINPLLYGLAIFQAVIEKLCQDFRIVTIDARGTGASDQLPRGYDLRNHMLDVAAVIDAVGGGPVIPVGFSRGANLVVKLAVAKPSMVRKIVLVGGHTVQTVGIGVESDEAERENDDFVVALEAENMERVIQMFVPAIISEPGTEDLRAALARNWSKLSPTVIVNFFTFDPEVDISDLLARIAVPTLVMHGTKDMDVPFTAARQMAEQISGARFYAFEGRGHLPTLTATAEFGMVLRDFIGTGTVPSSV